MQILVVDDPVNYLNRQFEHLEKNGYSIVFSNNRREILSLVKVFNISIVLINIIESEGTSLAIEIKVDYPFVKLIGILDESMMNKFDNASTYPFEEFLKIPYDTKDIFHKISRCRSNLNKSQLLVNGYETQELKIIRLNQRVTPHNVILIAIISDKNAYIDIGEMKDISSTGISFYYHCQQDIIHIDDSLELVFILPHKPLDVCSLSVIVKHINQTFIGANYSNFNVSSGQIIYDFVQIELKKHESFAS